MRVATNLIWLPVADGGNTNYVLVKEILCCLKITKFLCCLKIECVHMPYYFMVSIENGLIVTCNMYF